MLTWRGGGMSPFDTLRELRAVIDGKHPLDGWRHRRVDDVSVVHKDNTTVVLVYADQDRFYVTTYWGADPKEVEETVSRSRPFLDLSGEWSWSGGPEKMAHSQVFTYLAAGAKP